jgi:hypothetical protein
VTIGNGDTILDRKSTKFSQESFDLLTSADAKKYGIQYLDREVRTIAFYTTENGEQKPIRIYGNPLVPEFSDNSYPFTYHAHPSEEASAAWEDSPSASDGVQIWLTHGPPRHRLDDANVDGFIGCDIQARKIAAAKPPLCVFGHYHYSWGVERISWDEQSDAVVKADVLTLSEERKQAEGLPGPETISVFDFTGSGSHPKLMPGKETVFVNAAWMTQKKRQIKERNPPVVVTLNFT